MGDDAAAAASAARSAVRTHGPLHPTAASARAALQRAAAASVLLAPGRPESESAAASAWRDGWRAEIGARRAAAKVAGAGGAGDKVGERRGRARASDAAPAARRARWGDPHRFPPPLPGPRRV